MSLRLTEEEYGDLMRRRAGEAAKVSAGTVLSDTEAERRCPENCPRPTPFPPSPPRTRPRDFANSEEEEQIILFTWANYAMGTWPELALLFHIPNGGNRSPAEAGRFKAMGVKPGVPDLFLPVPRGGYSGLFIELKREHGGSLSDAQRDWLDDLSVRGYKAVMCHGWEAARDALLEYLGR